MRVLILGGSVFLGRAFAEAALRRGYEVTTFNRGFSSSDVAGVNTIRGDRENPTDVQRVSSSGLWDVVIDTCGMHPSTVGRSAAAFSGRAGTYLFISSVHAYADWPAGVVDEQSNLHECESDTQPGAVVDNALKAGCERAVYKHFSGNVMILNPGVIVGPGENTGRLVWWLQRIARGGRFVAPGRPQRHIQLIDARDIAEFGLDLLQNNNIGRYIVTGNHQQETLGGLLKLCCDITGSDAEPVWMNDDVLLEHGVSPWTDLPLWLPDAPGKANVWKVSTTKAVTAGLQCRSLAQTVSDTWQWFINNGSGVTAYQQNPPVHGLSPDIERVLLGAAGYQ